MDRQNLIEIHDHPRFPQFLRDLVTESLEALWAFGKTYRKIAAPLAEAMDQSGVGEVIDLCSGGGGPWPSLADEVETRLAQINPGTRAISIYLTDKYPSRIAAARAAASNSKLTFQGRPVDAVALPPEIHGFRTIFSSFHHFGPDEARKMLAAAMESRRGIGIFEAAQRSPRTLAMICTIPFLWIVLAPGVSPFRWSRLFWTYLVPVIPFVLWYDGLVSCLRAYSKQELEMMVQGLMAPEYEWRIGEAGGWVPITWVIGCPRKSLVSTEKEPEPMKARAIAS